MQCDAAGPGEPPRGLPLRQSQLGEAIGKRLDYGSYVKNLQVLEILDSVSASAARALSCRR